MYTNTAAVSRPELSEVFEEAREAEKHYVASQIMPVREVGRRTGRFPVIKIGPGNLLRRDSMKRSPGGQYPRTSRKHGWDTYDCADEGLEEAIDDSWAEEMSEFFEAEEITGRLLTRQVMIGHEIDVATQTFDEGTFGATESTEEYTEANLAAIDFPYDVLVAKNRFHDTVQAPNVLVLNDELWTVVRRSDKLIKYLFGSVTGAQQVSTDQVAKAFDLDKVIIAKGVFDASLPGVSTEPDIRRVWSGNYFGLVNVQGGDFAAGGFGRTLVWKADSPGGLFTTETYRNETVRGDMMRVRKHTAQKVIDESAIRLIKVADHA